MIDRLVYRSRAVGPSPEAELERIFRVSIRKNAEVGITGALGLCQGHYVQLLEGSSDALDGLMITLEADPRHTDIDTLLRGPSETRLVPGWTMARVDLARLTPNVERLVEAGDGLGLIALMATLAHEGLAR